MIPEAAEVSTTTTTPTIEIDVHVAALAKTTKSLKYKAAAMKLLPTT